jgi:hypothetical protein
MKKISPILSHVISMPDNLYPMEKLNPLFHNKCGLSFPHCPSKEELELDYKIKLKKLKQMFNEKEGFIDGAGI